MQWYNKRGQGDGPGLGTIVGFLLVIIIAAIIVIFVWKPFNQGNTYISTLPKDLGARAVICQGLVSSSILQDKADYCYVFTPVTIGGVIQLANCQYIKYLYPDAIVTQSIVTCTPKGSVNGNPVTPDQLGTQECISRFRNRQVDSSTIINGITCSAMDCKSLGGTLNTGVMDKAKCSANTAYPLGMDTGYSDSAQGVCCLPANAS